MAENQLPPRKETLPESQMGKDTKKRTPLNTLIDYFHSNEPTSKFAYKLALSALEDIQKNSESKEHFLEMVLTDIIFAALHTTIMEELFSALRIHQDVGVPLIQKFSESASERDQMINIHTKNHIRFMANNGTCEGCASCEGHNDIASLLPRWHKKDVDFFIKLYLEVQTIYCTLERVLYEYLPLNIEFADNLNTDLVTQYRTYIAHYVARRLSNT
jgi:hypothetical protein